MKKNKELLNIIGNIDDDMIEKAEPDRTKRKKITWTGVLSSAAILALVFGLQYKFIYKPLSDAPADPEVNPVTSVTAVSENAVTSEVITEAVNECSIKTVSLDENCGQLYPGDDESFIRLAAPSETPYIYLRVDGKEYDLDYYVEGNTSDGPDRAVVTDDYIFLMHSKKTYSFRKEDGSLVAETGGNHAEMDLSGSTDILGTNNAGELFVINTEYADGNEYHLMKYSPELELISETVSDNIVTDDAEQYAPLPDSVRGFEDMYIKGDKLYIEYGEKENVILSFETGIWEAGDTEGFVWGDRMEEKTQDFENGVYRSGKYYYFEDAANENTLTFFWDTSENGNNNDTDEQGNSLGMAVYDTYIDGGVFIGTHGKENADGNLIRYDTDGNVIETVTDKLKIDVMIPEREALHSEASYTLKESDIPEGSAQKYFEYIPVGIAVASDGSAVCSYVSKTDGSPLGVGVFSAAGECRVIGTDKLSGGEDYGYIRFSPQRDGTVVYINNRVLYSYDTNTDKISRICAVPEYYGIPTGDIVKISDDSYCLPPVSYDSNLRRFYILTVNK